MAEMHTDPILSPTTSQFPNQLAKNKEAMVIYSEIIDPSTLKNLEQENNVALEQISLEPIHY